MKRRVRRLLGAGVGLVAHPATVAQIRSGQAAQVCSITDGSAGSNFQIPQVRLPNAAVSRRVNRQLLCLVTDYYSTVDSTAGPAAAADPANAATMRKATAGWPRATA